jgi:Putative Ig domain
VSDALEAKGMENFGGVFATHRNSTTAGAGLRFTFDDFAVEQNRGPNRNPVVEPMADRTSVEGEPTDVRPQATDADGDTLTWFATGLPAGLTMNPATGAIGGTIAAGAARPEPYTVTITVTDGFGGEATESFAWTVTAETLPTVDQLKVNFQNAAAAIPDGYVRDYGLPYGPRSTTDQDGTGRPAPAAQAGLRYGWVDPGTATPRDLSVGGNTPGNGRDRNVLSDQRFDTLMHMQADDIVTSPFNGTPLPGSWEVALPDGAYDVSVGAGDPNVGGAGDPERHALSVEGEPALDFTPTGAAGAVTRRMTATVQDVEVSDGRLTLLATGQNTKVNFVEIDRVEPVNEAPTVEPIADRSDREGTSVDFDAVGSDPEDGTLTWSAAGLPAGVTIDPETGRIHGKLASGAADDSPYTVTVTATDDGTPEPLTGEASFTWTVTDGTAPGPVADLAPAAGDRKVELSWVNPDDSDFELVRIVRTIGAPAAGPDDGVEVYEGNASAATASGLDNGTEYTFTAFARDGAGNWSEAESVKSTPRHLAPVIDPIADQTNREGTSVDLRLMGTDPEGGQLTWSATGLPEGLEIDAVTGRIHGTIVPGTARQAPYRVTVAVTDDGTPQALGGTVSFGWTVTGQPSQPGNPNQPQPPAPTPPAPPAAPPADQPAPSRARAALRLAKGAALARQPVMAVELRGRLIGATAGRRTITIECARPGGRWRTLARTLTRPDGKFSARVRRLKRPVRCRARFAGDRTTKPALSSVRRIASIDSARQARNR